jgi:hypothetical protein
MISDSSGVNCALISGCFQTSMSARYIVLVISSGVFNNAINTTPIYLY